MLNKFFLISILFNLVIISEIFSQGSYLKEDIYAGIAGYTFSYVEGIAINSLSFGYTAERTLDIGGSYGFSNDTKAFAAGFNYNFFKNGFLMLSPGAAYVNYTFLSDNNKNDIKVNGFAIGLNLSKRNDLSEIVSFVPSINLSVTTLEEKELLRENNFISFNFNLGFVFYTKNDIIFGIEPALLFSDDNAGISISGFIIFN